MNNNQFFNRLRGTNVPPETTPLKEKQLDVNLMIYGSFNELHPQPPPNIFCIPCINPCCWFSCLFSS